MELFSIFDEWLFLILNQSLRNTFLLVIFEEITILGSVIFLLAVAVVLWAVGRKREALMIVIGVVVASILIVPLKEAVLRPRPFEVLPFITPRIVEESASFPSGHAERSILLATILGGRSKPRRALLWGVGALVSLSRVYIGVHWPTDVVVGGALGWIAGRITLRIDSAFIAKQSWLSR